MAKSSDVAATPVRLREWLLQLIDLASVEVLNIGLHGIVESGVVVAARRLPQFVGYDFRLMFHNQIGRVINDAYGAAIGAMYHFCDRVIYPAAIITLGTGVGMTLVDGPASIEPCETIPNEPLVPQASGSPVNLHEYLGVTAREAIMLIYPERCQLGCAEYSSRVVEVLIRIQRLTHGRFGSFVLLGGASWFLDQQQIERLSASSPELTSTVVLFDGANAHRIALDGIVRANQNL